MTRSSFLLGTVLAAALAAPALAQTSVTIAVGSTVFDVSQANNTSVPIATGCWEKEGLRVELQPTNTNAAIQALLTGKVDMVNAGPAAAIVARAKGGPLKSVYLNLRRNYYYLLVPEASAIRTVADLKGKTIGVFSYGAQFVRAIKGMLSEAKLNPETDVTFVETGTGAQAIAALKTGRVDAWGTWDSQLATAENNGLSFRHFSSPSLDRLVWGSSYFVRDDYAAASKDTIGKVLKCVAEGTALMLADPEKAIRAHWSVYPASKPSGLSDQEAMRQALHIVKRRSEVLRLEPGARFGEMPAAAASDMVNFMKATGELKGDVDPAAIATNAFVDAANSFGGPAVAQDASARK